jgi:beta-1,4-N-acetylglucosaminyltransferase
MVKTCFATVGTTQFAALVDTLLSADVLDALFSQGYRRLLLQLGRGPDPPVPADTRGVEVEWYRFKPSLEADMREAELIVSHAGAGSILEGMRLRKRMLVVVNDALMHNHQQELAQELHERKHLLATTPGGLLATLRALVERPPAFESYPTADPKVFGNYLNGVLGLS